MFTGIVEELGTVADLTLRDDGARMTFRASRALEGVTSGDSISVNGVCLTAVQPSSTDFCADVMAETLKCSSLGDLQVGDRVNLERARQLGDRLGGHLVQGHVDGIARITKIEPSETWTVMEFGADPAVLRYLVSKGSVAVDGISLTVVDVTNDSFTVSLIPTTLAETTLGFKSVGDAVNIEVDMVAKYVEKLVAK